MDILGPFPSALGQRKFLVVGVDYFTKWLEAELLVSITKKQAFLMMSLGHISHTYNARAMPLGHFSHTLPESCHSATSVI